ASHRSVDSFGEPDPERVDRPADRFLEYRALPFRKRLEHVVREVALPGVTLAADADTQPWKFVRPEGRNDRLDPFLSPRRAPRAHTQGPEGQVDVVRDDADLRRIDAVLLAKSRDRLTRGVHVRVRER